MNKLKNKKQESIFEAETVYKNNKEYLKIKEDSKEYYLIDIEIVPICGILFFLTLWLICVHYFPAN
jgi:hypothetical protein